ncbi:MAG: tetratricopeptide repeat protein [Omnitrophica bacterium]|nr:tetratricopeptide repeat protein [Candidatus Omnitrophota bacterium]
MKKRYFSKTKIIFIFLAILAFSLRAIYFRQTVKFISPGAGSDSYFYLEWAKSIVRGELIGKDVFYALPLYPYFLSIAYLFAGGELFGLVLIQLFIGSLNCGLIYILGKRLFNAQVGVIAALIACGYPMLIFYDRMILPTTLTICLGLLLMLLLLKIKDSPSFRRWCTAGLFLGLSVLAKASFALLAIFILFWIFYEYKKPFKKSLLYCLSFILPFFLVVGAGILRNYLVAGDPVLITAHSGINFYIGNNSQANGLFKPPPLMRSTQNGLIEDARIIAERLSLRKLTASEVSNFWFRRSLNFIRTQPLDYLILLGKKLVLFWNGREFIDEISYYIYNEEAKLFKLPLFQFSLICPLAVLGIFLSGLKDNKITFLYFFIFSLMLGPVLFFVNSRYRIIAVPYLIIFAAFSLWQLIQKYRNRQYKNLIFLLIVFFSLYFLTNIQITDASLPNSTFHYNKGVIFHDQGKYQKANEEFQLALNLNPLDFMSYLGLGNVYYQIEDLSQAIENYKISLKINPYFYNAHFNLGIIYREIGQNKQAQEEFLNVLKLKPEDCAAHYNLGQIYQARGLPEMALKEYQQALKIEPNHPEVLQAIKEIKQDN